MTGGPGGGNEHETADPWLPSPDAAPVPSMVHANIRGNSMDIGGAVKHLREGGKVARSGWNGKNMYLRFQQGGDSIRARDSSAVEGIMMDHVLMKTAQGDLVPWSCSQTDLLANDWETVA
jgi:hypothetical protein